MMEKRWPLGQAKKIHREKRKQYAFARISSSGTGGQMDYLDSPRATAAQDCFGISLSNFAPIEQD
jgi:hypothetical protein